MSIFAILAVSLVLLSITLYSSTEMVGAYQKRALEVVGDYKSVIGPGMTFVPPFVSETHSFDVRLRHMEMPDQSALTGDSIRCELQNIHIYGKICDVERFYKKDFESLESVAEEATKEAIQQSVSRKTADEIDKRYLYRNASERADEIVDDSVEIESIEIRNELNFEQTDVESEYQVW
jgi:Membrane protease subunits, stomatin/prohibitin homologs